MAETVAVTLRWTPPDQNDLQRVSVYVRTVWHGHATAYDAPDKAEGIIEIDLEKFKKFHYEVRAFYYSDVNSRGVLILAGDIIPGFKPPPLRIKVTMEGGDTLRQGIPVTVAGVSNENEEVTASPNGSYMCRWNGAALEYQAQVEVEEFGPGREGFLIGASVLDDEGNYYLRVIVTPSGEPIGGGPAGVYGHVTLDSGGAGFNSSGYAFAKI